MRPVVKTWKDIINNINTINRGLSHEAEEDYFLRLIRRGICFLIVNIDKKIFFAPSKFTGYANNTRKKHDPPKGYGGETNRAIREVMKIEFGDKINWKWHPDEDLEKLYASFCKHLGIEVPENGNYGIRRKFIDARSIS